jgi:hypothetical protein
LIINKGHIITKYGPEGIIFIITKDMSGRVKQSTGRRCKHTVGGMACTKYAQWTKHNKGHYCHKHFNMTSQQSTTYVPVDDTRGINDNSIVINASSNRQKRKMTVITSRAACDILSDPVDNSRENLNNIFGRE